MSDSPSSPTESRSSDKRRPPPPRERRPQAHRKNNSMSPGDDGTEEVSDFQNGAGSSKAEKRPPPSKRPTQQRRENTSKSRGEDDPEEDESLWPNPGRHEPKPRSEPIKRPNRPAWPRGNDNRRPLGENRSAGFSDAQPPSRKPGSVTSRAAPAMNPRARRNSPAAPKGDTIASGPRENGEWNRRCLEIEQLKKAAADSKREIEQLKKAAAESKREIEQLKKAAAGSRDKLEAKQSKLDHKLKMQELKTEDEILAEKKVKEDTLKLATDIVKTGGKFALEAHKSRNATRTAEAHRDMQAAVAERKKAEREGAQSDRSRPAATMKATVPASRSRANPRPVDDEDLDSKY